MATQAWLVFTSIERNATLVKNDTTDYKIEPRLIDNSLCEQLGDPVIELGKYLAPARLLNDANYQAAWGDDFTTFPIRMLDDDVVFLPPDY